MTWTLYHVNGDSRKGFETSKLDPIEMRSKNTARFWLEINQNIDFNRAIFIENSFSGRRIWPGRINSFWLWFWDLVYNE